MDREQLPTDQRLAGLAIETATRARAALHYNDPQTVRDMIAKATTTIDTFARTNNAPDTAAARTVLEAIIVRETLPTTATQHDSAAVLDQLRRAGFNAPDINIDATLRAYDIEPITARELDKQLGTQGQPAEKETAQETAQVTDADITIYTTPNCMGCAATKRQFDKMGVDYLVIDLSERPDLVENFKAQGLAQAPIVQTSTDTWSGMRPDKIKQVGRDYQSRTRTNNTGTTSGHER